MTNQPEKGDQWSTRQECAYHRTILLILLREVSREACNWSWKSFHQKTTLPCLRHCSMEKVCWYNSLLRAVSVVVERNYYIIIIIVKCIRSDSNTHLLSHSAFPFRVLKFYSSFPIIADYLFPCANCNMVCNFRSMFHAPQKQPTTQRYQFRSPALLQKRLCNLIFMDPRVLWTGTWW